MSRGVYPKKTSGKAGPLGPPIPLCVDLDGTLLLTDSLWESLLLLLRREPLRLPFILLALCRGRAALKAQLSSLLLPEMGSLPFNDPLIRWLREQKREGRSLILATATDIRIAQAVADYIGIFDEVLASDGRQNLKGRSKARLLVERFGRHQFDYAGDSRADLAVWRQARHAIAVGNRGLRSRIERIANVAKVFPLRQKRFPLLLRAIRLHQWLKNLLVFLPLLAAHQVSDTSNLLLAGQAFLLFGLVASAVYLLNDLLDLTSDRLHPRKCQRPFAAGALPLLWGILLAPLLLSLATLMSVYLLPANFSAILAAYFITSMSYSLRLKRTPMADIMILTALYILRIFAGGIVVSILPSFWLLASTAFLFLSLALVKRYTEMLTARTEGRLMAQGRGWKVEDQPLLSSLGISSGFASILVLTLYINSTSAQILYATPEALWLICPLLLYWFGHLWIKTCRGDMHDDPVVFVLLDRSSQLVLIVASGIILFATLVGL